jgi:hypothetical protein
LERERIGRHHGNPRPQANVGFAHAQHGKVLLGPFVTSMLSKLKPTYPRLIRGAILPVPGNHSAAGSDGLDI